MTLRVRQTKPKRAPSSCQWSCVRQSPRRPSQVCCASAPSCCCQRVSRTRVRLCHSCWRVMCSSLIPECRRTVDVDVNEPARCHRTVRTCTHLGRPLLRLRLAGEQKAQTRGLSQLGEVGAVSSPATCRHAPAPCPRPCRRARAARGGPGTARAPRYF